MTQHFSPKGSSKSIEEKNLGDSNKDLDNNQDSSKKKQRKSKSKEGIVGPTSPKSVSQLDKGKRIEEDESLAPTRRLVKG